MTNVNNLSPMSDDEVGFRDFETKGWNDVAEEYAASDVIEALTGPAAVAMVDAVEAGQGDRLLDLACGPGYASREARARGAAVVGVDITEAMVTVAAANVPDGEFRAAPAEEIPFPPDSFDIVVCGFGLPHFHSPEAVFEETRRVVRPGGRIAFTTWCTPDELTFSGLVFAAVVEHGTLEVPIPAGPDMFRFAAQSETVRTLGGLGYDHVSVRQLPLEITLDDADDALDVVLRSSVRIGALIEAQSTHAKEAIAASLSDNVEQMRRPDGKLAIPMPAVLITATSP